MKKLFSFLVLFMFGIFLVSCGGEEESAPAKITYVDPSTGETVEMEVGKTDDAEEIADILTKLEPTEEEMPTGMTINGKLTESSNVNAKMQGMDYKVTEKIDATFEIKSNMLDSHYVDLDFVYDLKNEVMGMTMTQKQEMAATVYGDAEYLYTEYSTKMTSKIPGQEDSVDETSNKSKSSMEDIMAEFEGMMGDFGSSSEGSSTVLEGMSTVEMLEYLDASISNTTATAIELKINLDETKIEEISGQQLPFTTNAAIAIYVTINVTSKMPTKIVVDCGSFIADIASSSAQEMYETYDITSAKCKLEVNIAYEASNIPTLSDAQKAEYRKQVYQWS